MISTISADQHSHVTRYVAWMDSWLDRNPAPMLALKKEHSLRVLALAEQILVQESFSQEEHQAAFLGALYHDAGRFPQYQRWKTFQDATSEDHGLLGVRTVREQHFLDGESARCRGRVLASIALHNQRVLPEQLSSEQRRITGVVRDADKIDIIHIMAGYLTQQVVDEGVSLHVRNEPSLWSSSILDRVLSGMIPSYTDLVFVNDFKILLISWLHDLTFPSAKKLVREQGDLTRICDSLPRDEALRPLYLYAEQLLGGA